MTESDPASEPLPETGTPPDVVDATTGGEEPGTFTLPAVPLRDNVVFPSQLAPLAAGRPHSVAALEAAVNSDGRVILAIQRDASQDDVGSDDLHPIALLAHVGAFRRLPGAGAQALVEGRERVRIEDFGVDGDAWHATVSTLPAEPESSTEVDALAGSVKLLFAEYVSAGAAVSPDVAMAMARASEAALVADIASTSPDLSVEERISLLQEVDLPARLRRLAPALGRQVEVAQLRSKINEDVQKTINKSQREHILREQLRAVRKELSELEGGNEEEEDLVTRIEATAMPDAVKQRVLKEARRLEQIPSASPEMGMVRTWVDLLLELPWGDPPAEDIDIEATSKILDEDHYGLRKVKDRILEWLAVRERTRARLEARAEAGTSLSLQTPILCFVGPPGVGKTSLGRSIARALDRKFVRMSLGGIRDEAEIRGHRRTYIGSMPGRIIQSMRTAGTRNPVIMLDEVDKVGTDFRGDPAAALLEVLDPEQNREFSDHYLEVAYDLSQVLFITTANIIETVSPALRDRMEVIRISGYTEQEKVGIAQNHLLPKQLEQHGLDSGELEIPRETLVAVLHGYTREAGVRQLDRGIAEIARKVPRKLALGEAQSVTVTPGDLSEYLGPQRFDYGEAQESDEVGAVTGVVVSEIGGDIVTVEALAIPGQAELSLTGQLGSVMEESARAALSWARVHAVEYGAAKDFFDNHTIHVHVPAGAIPKDGPSAGITMASAMVSVATGRPVRRDLAMTGEVTLRGRVLPIGGVKDKLLAAHRAGLRTFLLPRKNLRDLHDIEPEILSAIDVVAVDTLADVLDRALLDALPGATRARRGVGFVLPLTGSQGPSPINASNA